MSRLNQARFQSDFFRDQYRRSVILLVILSCVSLLLVCLIGWFLIFKKNDPVYYGASIQGKVISLVPEKLRG